MRSALVGLSLFCLSVGCAGLQESSSAAARVTACSARRSYSDRDVAVMLRMRDNGDGRRDVANRLGGTPDDVRCAEARARDRRRTAQATHLETK